MTEIIRLDGVEKRFGGVHALRGVTFGIPRGEVHAIVGENGAGKSTLMKMLAGVHAPDSGRILLRGEPVRIGSPADARRAGISIVFQELNLFPDRSVAANVFANRELRRGPFVDHAGMRRETGAALAQMEVRLDPGTRVGRLSVGERQLVEIARTLQQRTEIIILDEPNSALSGPESERLFAIIRRLRDQGMTLLYVSHRLEEVFAIADRITVLRDGQYRGSWRPAETSIPHIIAEMIGRRLEEAFPQREAEPGEALLEAQELRSGEALGPVSFQARAGEILGFAGLEGAGVDALFHSLFGLAPVTGGAILAAGQPVAPRSPAAAMRQGWGLIPASRRDEGLMMEASVRRNTTLLVLDRLAGRLGLLSRGRTRALAEEYVERLRIVTASVEKPVVQLSGGNQQKVLLAKWLATGPRVLLLNDPTRGVDVGAKAEIYRLCDHLAREGLALLVTSSEIEELLGLCDRLLVLHRGRVVREFGWGEATKAEVMQAMAGGGGA